jgi:molybdopterin converting factor small subunit
MVVVQVKFFGDVKSFTDVPKTIVELNDGATVADLLQELDRKYGTPFHEGVLSESNELYGVKGHVKLFLNGDVVESRNFPTTKVIAESAPVEATFYVVSATTGG